MLVKALAIASLLALTSSAAPLTGEHPSSSFIQSRDDALPLLQLDYGTYRAAQYNADADIYTFKNIRYAAPPTGNLRWRKPQPPNVMSDIQDGSVGAACLQPLAFSPQSEDCLFLDMYVPGKALNNQTASLPVAVWIHGGGNTNGSKDLQNGFFYNGTGPIQSANNNLIFISANYRLGPWGYLSGTTMEKTALPNAGLHDIRAVFRWVQNYIALVGGDKKQVSAWGESAGATNLYHNLVAQGGTLDPLFTKAVLLSPSTITDMDRGGVQEKCFQAFASLAGCAGKDVTCLRGVNSSALQTAAAQLGPAVDGGDCNGVAADGTYIRQAATLEFANNFYWKGLDSIIVSHVANEGAMFVPSQMNSNADFQNFVSGYYPQYSIDAGVVNSILKYYPTPKAGGTYTTQFDRASAWVRDYSFNPAFWDLNRAYAGKAWALQYSAWPKLHAADLTPLFWKQGADPASIKQGPATASISLPLPNINPLAATYQAYMTSHARFGDPNTAALTNQAAYPAINWPKPGNVTSGPLMTNVLDFSGVANTVVTDNQMTRDASVFQQQVAAAVTNLGGWAVPGTSISSGNVAPSAKKHKKIAIALKPSRNYVNICKECRET